MIIQTGLAFEKTALNPDYYRALIDDTELHEQIWNNLWQKLTKQDKLLSRLGHIQRHPPLF